MQLVEVAPHRAHTNRKGRWSEQRNTPTVQGRGDRRDHFYQILILADLRGQGNA